MHVQSAIASTPTAAWQGYLLGGIMWFCIPFTLSTGLGLATVACDLPVSVDEANMVQYPKHGSFTLDEAADCACTTAPRLWLQTGL